MLVSHYNRITVPQNADGRHYASLFKDDRSYKITEDTTAISIEFTDYFEVWTEDDLNSRNITETEYTIAKGSETVDFKNGKNQF